jgi:hypothetical protein
VSKNGRDKVKSLVPLQVRYHPCSAELVKGNETRETGSLLLSQAKEIEGLPSTRKENEKKMEHARYEEPATLQCCFSVIASFLRKQLERAR